MIETVQNPFQQERGPWEDYAPQSQQPGAPAAQPQSGAPWSDFSNETVMGKTSQGVPMAPPASFRQEPSTAGLDPARFSRFLNGMFKGYAGAEQLMAHGLEFLAPETGEAWAERAKFNAQQLEREQEELGKYAGLEPGSTDWWNIAGQVASPINWIGGEGAVAGAKAIPMAARAIEGTGLGAAAARGAIQGAGISAVQPVTGEGDYGSQKLAQIASGAGTGAVAAPVVNVAGRVVKPAISAAAQKLEEAGVKLTPGQLLGPFMNRIENIAQGYPFAGMLVRNARDQTGRLFQIGAANKALKPIGETVSKGVQTGSDLIEHVEAKISNAYNRIHPNIGLRIDTELAADLSGIAQRATSGALPEAEERQLQKIIDSQINGKIARSKGMAHGKVVQSMTSEIGRKMIGYAKDPSFDKRQLAGFLGDVREALANAIERQNPKFAQPLKQANAAWRLYAKIRDAAGRQGGEIGEFSPAQLERAAKQGETAGAKAKGTAPLQSYASAYRKVAPPVPDSGTPERAAMLAALHGGLWGAGVNPATHLVAPLGISALYSPAGLAASRAAILSRPPGAQFLRDILQKYGPQAAGRLPLIYNTGQ